MNKDVEQTPETYDEMYREGGYAGIFGLPYKSSPYFPLFKYVLHELKRHNVKSVLEVGCGAGAFAHMLQENSDITYRGFDFSGTAVEQAGNRFGRPELFFQGDARETQNYEGEYDAIVCTEVLEHVVDDLAVMALWPSDKLLVCSVPNFDSDTHERFFANDEEVAGRYGSGMEITRMQRIKHPVLQDISLRSYLKAIRWKRNKPREIMEILGFGSFDNIGGWFVMTGQKPKKQQPV